MMTQKTIILVGLALLSLASLPLGGCNEDDKGPCEQYCEAEEACQSSSGQMFSATECEQDCKISVERHDSVGCGDQMEDLLFCIMDLPCGLWEDYGDRCAYEIDYLDMCVGGNS